MDKGLKFLQRFYIFSINVIIFIDRKSSYMFLRDLSEYGFYVNYVLIFRDRVEFNY